MSIAAASWLAHPLAEALLRFNLLPSHLLHPSRRSHGAPRDGQAPSAAHRHWSAALQREHRLAPVTSLSDAALPLAMLGEEAFARLVLFSGVALNGAHIRHAITRTDVSLLREQLGEDALAFAHARQGRGLAGIPTLPGWDAAGAHAHCLEAGGALIAHAFREAGEGVARRGMLRLPDSAQAACARLEQAGLASAAALALVREFIEILEPSWLSSFPAPR